MKVVCAWCERQGKAAVLHEKAPDENGVSHGICDDHARRLLRERRRPRRLDSAREIVAAGAASGGQEE